MGDMCSRGRLCACARRVRSITGRVDLAEKRSSGVMPVTRDPIRLRYGRVTGTEMDLNIRPNQRRVHMTKISLTAIALLAIITGSAFAAPKGDRYQANTYSRHAHPTPRPFPPP